MIDELFVPLDGMNRSLGALAVAGALGRRLGVPVSTGIVADPHLDAMADVEWLERHAPEAGVELRRCLVVPAQDTISTLLELTEESPGTVLCMSSHGRSGIGQVVLGSVSAAVVRNSEAPVLLVGPDVIPPTSFATIEICLDGSALAERAVGPAVEWARALRATPWFVTVEHPGVAAMVGDTAVGAEVRQPAEQLRSEGFDAEWEILHGADVANRLASRAEELEATLIVAATHGRTGLSAVAMGSVAAGIVRGATRPVLVIGPQYADRRLAA